MNLQNLRWPVVVVAMAAALLLLFGGGFVLKNQTVDEPLKMLYNGSPVVEKSELVRSGDGYAITLTLKDTPDLATAYGNLDTETHKVLKDIPYTIKIADHRDPALEQVYHQANLYVQEALATGHFADMADKVNQEAARAGMSASLSVDSNRVYLQMKDKDGYLYSVVNRPQSQASLQRTAAEGGMGL